MATENAEGASGVAESPGNLLGGGASQEVARGASYWLLKACHGQNVSFRAICMTLAGDVPLMVPAVALPIDAAGRLKFARLKELNISHR